MSNFNVTTDKFYYKILCLEVLKNWNQCFYYLEEFIKTEKSDLESSFVFLFEKTCKKIVSKKFYNLKNAKNLINSKNKKEDIFTIENTNNSFYFINDLISDLNLDIIRFIDNIIRIIDNYLLKKRSVLDIHLIYYLKIKADYLLFKHELFLEMLSLNNNNNKTSDPLNINNCLIDIENIYVSIIEQLFNTKKLYICGDKFSLKIIISYSYFAINYLNNKETLNKLDKLLINLIDSNETNLKKLNESTSNIINNNIKYNNNILDNVLDEEYIEEDIINKSNTITNILISDEYNLYKLYIYNLKIYHSKLKEKI